MVRITDWPIATKMTVYTTVMSVVLAGSLTTLGYLQARAGLTDIARAADGARAVDDAVKSIRELRVAA